ncbi:metal homeostatis protein Bsd2 [Lepidopterella palustris CBS 459.81]|uniref:Metal homeostatis protein Bsd2 n=1 Tax=Lepidopterella palustris CBS 459.81 TaxID=1314670 RepID=A0A8E2DXZ8_9PEZI|nr:metal homeostatis protein Bsd2 [Lepidopterella palustris CBS 459.81]
MSPQRYERVAEHDDLDSPTSPHPQTGVPNSPPPSFHSLASSPTSRHLLAEDPLATDADRTLADTFDSPSDGDDSDDEHDDGIDDRQRLMRAHPTEEQNAGNGENRQSDEVRPRTIERRVTQLPVFVPQTAGARGRVYGGGQNDGVFANLSAKPTRGEELEEKPPSYEQAAADATPPYWETTILAPGMVGDEVFVEGLPVGSVFSFIWNAMISMSFQLVGFLLTYLLHTTHAAKNGSRAGLGITLVQYGFSMKGASTSVVSDGGADFSGAPPDPNSHDFDPNAMAPSGAPAQQQPSGGGITTSDWLAYMLMIVGWFILIKSISDFAKARRHEQLVLQSPDRGLGVAVVAEGEAPERSV